MYSTSMKDERYFAKCLMVAGYVKSYRFLVDTGAKYTCCHYKSVDVTLREKHFLDHEQKYIGGFVKGSVVTFYRVRMRQFTIGNIDMGEQDIWITFDDRVTDAVLGMDILKQIMMITNPYEQRIYFCKDAEDYHQHFEEVMA